MHPTSFSNSNSNHVHHSKPSQFHYHPHYIHLIDQPIVHEVFEQPFSNNHHHSGTVNVVAHEKSNLKATNVQSTMEKSSYDNGKFVPAVVTTSSRKDRHSKINTAQGPRDRRMRLSLDVAKKFFRLQDMLGFDKASNTIEWLLMKSKCDIRDLITQKLNQSCSLMGLSNRASSGSDCEVLSGIDDQSVEKTGDYDDQVIVTDDHKAKFTSCSINKKEKKRVDRIRKSVYIHNSLAKETREKARAWARKRTTDKRNIKLGYDQYSKTRPTHVDQVMDQNTNRLGSWVPFGENQVQTIDQTECPSSHFQFKQATVGDNSSLMSTNWNPSFLQFNYQHNLGPSHEYQFISDFQILGKPWEGINN